jgi:outer membrane protein assembly factor BamB
MAAEPAWVGYVGDGVIVGSALRLVAVGPDGKVKWRFPEDVNRVVRPVTNPFAPAGVPGVAADRPGSDAPLGRLHDFHVVAGRIFCQRGDREMLALDGEAGGVDWTYAPSSGHLNPNALFGPKRVVLQVLDPEAMVVLETETGRRREFLRSSKERAEEPVQAWSRSPLVIDDDHICVDIDPRTVASVDVTTGRRAWTSRVTSTALPRNGPPRLLGDSVRLLVVYEGNELVRLDPATGRKLWSRSLGLEDLSGQGDAFALDGDRLYCATNATLAAYNLGDGSRAWSRPLLGPSEGWAIATADRYVAAYPIPGRSRDGPLDTLPVIVCRREDGGLLQRLSFPLGSGDSLVCLLPGGAMVATPGGVWALGERH